MPSLLVLLSKALHLEVNDDFFSFSNLPCDGMMRSQICTKILLVTFVVWFIILLFAARHLSSLKSGSSVGQEENSKDVVSNRLNEAINKLQVLQQRSEQLKRLCEKVSNTKETELMSEVITNSEKIMKNLEANSNDFVLSSSPSAEYEAQRKRIQDDVQEFWFFISSQLNKLRTEHGKFSPELGHMINKTLRAATEHKLSLMKDINTLARVDSYETWRKTEAANLAALLQQRLRYLQNPDDCDTARKLICNLNKGCGFGCQIHHAAYCLIVAYATKRTLILTSKGWRYHKSGWEDIFLPVSETCLSPSGSSTMTWPGKPDTQVVTLPIIDTLSPRPDYLPPAIPKDLAPRLMRLHSQPLAWWIGQFVRYLMRPQPSTSTFFASSKQKMKFTKPIVGVHIRRTDKIGTEAAFHPIEEYMKHVDEWYDQQILNGLKVDRRKIYLATDDPKVIYEARKKYPDYDVLGDPNTAKTAGIATRYSDNSLYGIMLDIHFLSLSDHLVCTFSSQVCRVAYEIMQTYDTDATTHFTSLDDVYYYGGQNTHTSVAIIPHVPQNPSELTLEEGDPISVAGNHWNGYSKGRNLRTNQIGLYPSFKVQTRVKVADFPTYEEVPKPN